MGGFKNFRDNQILTSDNFMEFLANQCIIVCLTTSDRDLALNPYKVQGMVSYVKDINEHFVYDGSTWSKIATYDEVISTYNPRDNLIINKMESIL